MLRLTTAYPRKRTLISGAASGFGEAFSVQLAADGWTVGLCDVNSTALEEAAARVEAAGGTPLTYAFDVRDRDAYRSAVEQFIAHTGGIDLLINNAGIGSGGILGDFSLEDWDKTLGVNLMGVVHGLHFAVPHMKQQRSGHIINTASAAAFAAAPGMAAYNASKAAVLAISETLRTELQPFNIHTSVLMPTFVQTNLHKTLIGTPEAIAGAERMITRARHTAGEVARFTLAEAGRGEFYVLFPKVARKMWNLKRWFPGRYFKETLKTAARMGSQTPANAPSRHAK